MADIARNAMGPGGIAMDDFFDTDDRFAVSGNVFDDNGFGPDDAGGGTLTVTAVNGQAADVGLTITLASGTTLTVNSDGSFTYDTSQATMDGVTLFDQFDYTAEDGGGNSDTATVRINVRGLDNDDVIVGTPGDDNRNNDIRGGLGNDTIDGLAGDDEINGGLGDDFIDGGAGVDTVSYSSSLGGATVDLRLQGVAQDTGINGFDTLVNIENLSGSNFDDVLVGDSGANELRGSNGDDTLDGAGGADELIGGGGFDTASYQSSSTGLRVDFDQRGSNTGDAQGDSYNSISRLLGSNFDDVLIGATEMDGADGDDYLLAGRGSGPQTLRGGEGNDRLDGGNGADILDGGNGIDEVSYHTTTASVVADMQDPSSNSNAAAGDSYIDVENLQGSVLGDMLGGDDNDNVIRGNFGNDMILGRAGNDTLNGEAGNDVMEGGIGADQHDGGAGSDTVSYAAAAAGVVADLVLIGRNTGEAAGDTYANIQNLTGSAGDDTLWDNFNAGILTGLSGSDTLIGRGGADTLIGGTGDDIFDFNSVAESQTAAADNIMDFALGDLIDVSSIDADTTTAGNQAFAFIGSAVFSGTAGELRVVDNGAFTEVTADIDGDSVADLLITLGLNGGINYTPIETDFVL